MKNNPLIKTALLVLIMVFLFGAYISLRLRQSRYIHEARDSFGDTDEYLAIASRPLFSPSFWIAEKPSGVPLFFKLLQNDLEMIFRAQLWISILSWGLLAFFVQNSVRFLWLKPLSFGLILAFGLSQNIIMWDPLILSESISISLLALFIGFSIWLLMGWRFYKFVVLAVLSIMLILVRDSYSYFLLMCAGVLLFMSIYPPPDTVACDHDRCFVYYFVSNK